jgi:hypothetical protein
MGHVPDDDNFEQWMDSSAEEWSKPQETGDDPEPQREETDRWGSPVTKKDPVLDDGGWQPEIPSSPSSRTSKKGGFKWWIILIILVVLLCICTFAVVAGLQIFNVIDLF